MRFLVALAAAALGGCDADDDFETVVGVGQVWVTSTTTSSAIEGSYRPLIEYLPDCMPAAGVSANCSFGNCLYSPDQLGEPRPAGTIRVSGGLEDVELEPGEDDLYRLERDQPFFAGGEELTFEVAGNGKDIGESGLTLVAPEFVSVTEPAMSDPPEPLVVDRSADLVVEWTPVEKGIVRVHLGVHQTYEDSDQIREVSLSCRFEASRGTGRLIAEHIDKLPRVEDATTAELWVGSEVSGRTFGRWEHWFAISAYESRPVTIP